MNKPTGITPLDVLDNRVRGEVSPSWWSQFLGLSPKFPHTPRKTYPVTVQQQQLADKDRFNPDWHHAYVQTPKRPTTTALDYAYGSLALVEFSPIGWGDAKRQTIKALSSNGVPMLYYAAPGPVQGTMTQGLGGLVQGQLFMQPLYDPNTQNLAPSDGGTGM